MKIAKLSIIKAIRNVFVGNAVNIRHLLLVYLLLIMFTMLGGVILLSLMFDVLPSGSGEREMLFKRELLRLYESASKQYGSASIQAIRMSEQISEAIGVMMKKVGISPTELHSHPELLEPLLQELRFDLLIFLHSSEFSGAFVTLNATVNPNIRGAQNSKAGIYIRSIEPNIGGTGTEKRYLLRGFPSLAYDGYINFQANWDLEFNVKDQLFWIEPLRAHVANSSLPLSRLIYWCSMSPVQGLNGSVMVCSVPLIDDAGRALGVCGLEISEMNFMLRHDPDISGSQNVVCRRKSVFMISSANNGQIRLDEALFSGNNAVYNTLRKQKSMSVTGKSGELSIYSTPDGAVYVGMDKPIRLYPYDSPFAGTRFTTALVVPWEDYNDIVSVSRLRLIKIGAVLICFGVALSLFLSHRYDKSFKELMEALRSGDLRAKSQIQEIDDLLEFMRAQLDETKMAENGSQKSGESLVSTEYLLESFIANTKKLSRAEADVFNLYLEGNNAQEIASMLNISLNTIKTHNRHIFAKLNVSSRKELLTWIQVLISSGHPLKGTDDTQQDQINQIKNIIKSIKDNSNSED